MFRGQKKTPKPHNNNSNKKPIENLLMLNFEKQIIAGYIKTDHRRALQTCTRLGKPTQSRHITLKKKKTTTTKKTKQKKGKKTFANV